MIPAPILADDKRRLQALDKYDLIDTMPEQAYDDITAVTASICQAPIALINLVHKDKTFFKSQYGVDLGSAPRDISFCAHTIVQEDDVMIVTDAREDERFRDNPFVTSGTAIFYAGVPLIDKNGYKLGSLCVFDSKPRELNDSQLSALKSMANHVMLLFEERYSVKQLLKTQNELKERNEELKDFAGIVSHDLKAPLSNIMMIAGLLKKENQDILSEKSINYLSYLNEAGISLSRYIDGMLMFYKSDELVNQQHEDVSYVDMIEDVITMAVTKEDVLVTYAPEMDVSMHTSKAALQQILLNLVTNSVKYGDKAQTIIHVQMKEFDDHYTIQVEDNGRGIESDKLDSVFKLFYTASEQDRNGNKGTGIGLATTKRLLEHLEGTISIESEYGVGTSILMKFPKNIKRPAA
ncbi:GAF domain-containing sensor histidine kinase [Nonlabens ponticola]|uniref:histidine kinase n=1 Tax=Nonlabens ponticola TaxID=2496866 RepID=A0A3S9MYV2_9FLAO|nr:GAF domain-containing sensor histidine kinase [Nonlabens ponticola]AZQ44337.1 sensor histidine kinase [Nonlabens ponticola]